MRRALVASAAVVLVVSSCSSRPETQELTDSVLRAGVDEAIDLTDEQAECIASRLVESELSDTTLRGLVENFDNPEVLASDVDKVKPIVAQAAIDCAG